MSVAIDGQDYRSPTEIAGLIMERRQMSVTASAITYHCRSGGLRFVARQFGRQWFVPVDDADRFIDHWEPYRRVRG